MLEARFDRLDAKVDKIADAMTKLIEHDAKIEGLVKHNNAQDARINKQSTKLDDHAIKLATIGKASGSNEWFIRVLIAAAVSTLFILLRD
jgi:hypothetical protein